MTKVLNLDYEYFPRVRYGKDSPHRLLREILARGDRRYAALLGRFAALKDRLAAIPVRGEASSTEPSWYNGWIPGLDSMSIYCLLALRNPPTYLEVGSGNSTKFARRAIRDFGLRTRIVSIDPCPRADINALCDTVVRAPFEDADPSVYRNLEPGSLVFVDNSHRSFQNSDVTVFFLEMLPGLPEGVTVGLHDILLPYDYPQAWVEQERFYNEQYLLAAFLLGGCRGYEVTLPCHYAFHTPEVFRAIAPVMQAPELEGIEPHGSSFWMTRTGEAL
ncbi:MAG: class I SAM-dependent methyltransferase [Acidobacteriota bacterium]